MTQENKELLLRDLCSRLPYGVIIKHEDDLSKLDAIFMCDSISISSTSVGKNLSYNLDFDELKPYLFPLSSMSEEQEKEYRKVCDLDMEILENRPMKGEPFPAMYNSQDWLDANHFDYRGLIPLGLAIDATGLNIY